MSRRSRPRADHGGEERRITGIGQAVKIGGEARTAGTQGFVDLAIRLAKSDNYPAVRTIREARYGR